MNSVHASLSATLVGLCLLWSPAAVAEARLSVNEAQQRIEAVERALTTHVKRIAALYSYETVQETIKGAADAGHPAIERAARPLGTRIYALWATLERRIGGELARLRSSERMVMSQTFALTRDIEWLEHVGARIGRELVTAETSLDELVKSALLADGYRTNARSKRADMKRTRAALARLPGGSGEDPLADLARAIRYDELAEGCARATAHSLEDTLVSLAAKEWMPLLTRQKDRREISLTDIELPPALLASKPVAPWVAGATSGSKLAEAMANWSNRISAEGLTPGADFSALERVADSRDVLDRSRVRSLQIEGLATVRDARALQSSLERLPELRSVTLFANGKRIFDARRPSVAEVERLVQSVIAQGSALNEMLHAVLLLRRQLVFHAMVAERGRGLRPTGDALDTRSTIQRLFTASRAAHVLERDKRQELERFYSLKSSPLKRPEHLRVALERFLLNPPTLARPENTPTRAQPAAREHPADAEAMLAVARLLAKLSDDRAHVPLRAAKRAIRKWRFPVPGYPAKPADALQVLADDLTAWVHLPAAVWSETAFRSLLQSLRSDIKTLRALTTVHRSSDGMALSESVTIRDGMHIEVLLALSAEHEGELKVTVAGEELAGEGLYYSTTPGLLFATTRLNIAAGKDAREALVRLLRH